MYYVIAIGLMVVVPAITTAAELAITGDWTNALAVVGKWFLFFGVGVRLLVAGISQVANPSFTAENILGEKNSGANQVVRELGFANLGFGIAGLIAPWIAGWAVPVAIAPAIFLFLDGVLHVIKPHKNAKEWTALVTDFVVAIVLAVFVIGSVAS